MEAVLGYQQDSQGREDRRAAVRRPLCVSGRIVWRDPRGATRFATIRTRDVSDESVFVECLGGASIPLFRLVHVQLDLPAHGTAGLPPALRLGKASSAVYRVGPVQPTTGLPDGYALRLLADPVSQQSGRAAARADAQIVHRFPAFIAAQSFA